jgi:hypothetical protein
MAETANPITGRAIAGEALGDDTLWTEGVFEGPHLLRRQICADSDSQSTNDLFLGLAFVAQFAHAVARADQRARTARR